MPLRLLVLFSLLAACGADDVGSEAAPPARADEYVSEALDEELDAIGERVQQRGYSPADDLWRGFLVDGAIATRRIALRSGQCVVWVAVASNQLRSLELSVHDGDGAEMARSASGEGGVRYCAASSGVHFAVVRAEGNGLFAARRFDGPRGIALRFDDLRAPPEALQPAPTPPRGVTP